MADAVSTTVIADGDRNYVVQLQSLSDGTGESAVTKVDISTLSFSDGTTPNSLSLQEANWNIQGFTSVQLYFDATTDDLLQTLNGVGYRNYADVGGISDPQSTGSTGDIKLTTNGAAVGASYDITLRFKKKG